MLTIVIAIAFFVVFCYGEIALRRYRDNKWKFGHVFVAMTLTLTIGDVSAVSLYSATVKWEIVVLSIEVFLTIVLLLHQYKSAMFIHKRRKSMTVKTPLSA